MTFRNVIAVAKTSVDSLAHTLSTNSNHSNTLELAEDLALEVEAEDLITITLQRRLSEKRKLKMHIYYSIYSQSKKIYTGTHPTSTPILTNI